MTEYINRAEIKGRVGSVKIIDTEGGKIAKLAVVTESISTNRDGFSFINNTWHCVKAWNREGIPDIDTIASGAVVHVQGQMRQAGYVSADGFSASYAEIVADKLEILN